MRLWVIVAAVAIAACGGSPSAPEDVKSLIVVGTPPSIGTSTHFTALTVHNDGTTAPITSQVTWRSSNTAVATVKDDGTVTGVSRGSVEISAAASGMRGALTFNVESGPAFRVSGSTIDGGNFTFLPGVTIVVKDASGESLSVVSDNTGAFSIQGVAGGPIEITGRADGYITTTVATQLVADLAISVTLGRVTPCPVFGFDDLAVQRGGGPFTTSTACGFTVTATTSNWTVANNFGRPFAQFTSPPGTPTSAELVVTAAGGKFKFESFDVTSGFTAVPYTITGIANGAAAFVLQDTLAAPLGIFRTVNSSQPSVPIDALLIHLSNPSAPASTNGIGVDNIVLAR